MGGAGRGPQQDSSGPSQTCSRSRLGPVRCRARRKLGRLMPASPSARGAWGVGTDHHPAGQSPAASALWLWDPHASLRDHSPRPCSVTLAPFLGTRAPHPEDRRRTHGGSWDDQGSRGTGGTPRGAQGCLSWPLGSAAPGHLDRHQTHPPVQTAQPHKKPVGSSRSRARAGPSAPQALPPRLPTRSSAHARLENSLPRPQTHGMSGGSKADLMTPA